MWRSALEPEFRGFQWLAFIRFCESWLNNKRKTGKGIVHYSRGISLESAQAKLRYWRSLCRSLITIERWTATRDPEPYCLKMGPSKTGGRFPRMRLERSKSRARNYRYRWCIVCYPGSAASPLLFPPTLPSNDNYIRITACVRARVLCLLVYHSLVLV